MKSKYKRGRRNSVELDKKLKALIKGKTGEQDENLINLKQKQIDYKRNYVAKLRDKLLKAELPENVANQLLELEKQEEQINRLLELEERRRTPPYGTDVAAPASTGPATSAAEGQVGLPPPPATTQKKKAAQPPVAATKVEQGEAEKIASAEREAQAVAKIQKSFGCDNKRRQQKKEKHKQKQQDKQQQK